MAFCKTTLNIRKLYTKLKFSKRRVDTYQFRVLVTTDEKEMATQNHGPNPCLALASFLVNSLSPPLGADSLSPRKTIGGTCVPREGHHRPNRRQWVT